MSKKIAVTALFALVFVLASTNAFAQDEEIPHNDISFSVGAAVPTGSDTAYLKKAPMIALIYGYRFDKFFQAESGFQMAFGAANNQNLEESEFGTILGGDHEFMIPFTARFIVPLPWEKWQVSVGGGLMWLHYAETATSGASLCFTCTSRGGWGPQGSLKVRHFLGESNNFFVGGTGQYVSGSLSGEPVGNIPGIKTTDHWYNILGEVGFRF